MTLDRDVPFHQKGRRRRAVLTSLLVPVLAGLYVAGYIMGARAEHPNSPWTMALMCVIGWVLALLWLLWEAAGEESDDA